VEERFRQERLDVGKKAAEALSVLQSHVDHVTRLRDQR
jgi:hypothetical protein